MLELSEEEAMSPEHLDSQVQKAQEQLLQLKRQSEQIEKQKRELEELSRRQEELERGRAEMTDKLSRSLVILEREGYDSQKKLEQIRATHESFTQHLQLLEAIEPKTWNPAELPKELSRALEHGGRRADGIQPAAEPARGREHGSINRPGFAGGRAGSFGTGRRENLRAMGADRFRRHSAADYFWDHRAPDFLLDGREDSMIPHAPPNA